MPPVLSSEQIEEKRTMLVQEAMGILERDGIAALTARYLADCAKVSRSTPYLYFKDKAAIIDAVKVAGLRRLIIACEKAIIGVDHYGEHLRRLGETYVDFGINHPVLYQLIFMSGESDTNMSQALAETIDEYKILTLGPLEKAYAAGVVTMPPERLNLVLWASVHGLLTLRNVGLLGDDEAFSNLRSDLEIVLAKGFLSDNTEKSLIDTGHTKR